MLEHIKYRKHLEAMYNKLSWEQKAVRYQKNPMLWLEERFGEDPSSIQWSQNPAYDKHKFDGSVDPLYNAWMDLTGQHFVGLESATGTGKTYIGSRIIYWFLDVFYNSLVVVIGPTTAQLKANMWAELRTAYPKFNAKRLDASILSNELRVINRPDKHSWHAIMRSGSGESKGDEEKATAKLSGFHRKHMLFVFDEMQGVSKTVQETVENTCTGGNNLMIAFGNPDSEQDTLHKFCVRHDVKHYIVSGLDHPNVVLDKELIPGAVTRKSIKRRKEKYGEDSPFFLSRVRGICPNHSMTDLFNLVGFDEICKTECTYDQSSNAVGIDPSNSEGGDESALTYGMRNMCMAIVTFNCPDCNLISDNVLLSNQDIIDEHGDVFNYGLPKLNDFDIKEHNVGVDSVGIGIGTLNAFINKHKFKAVSLNGAFKQDLDRVPKDNKKKPLYVFGNLRAQMIWQFAHDVNNGLISFANVSNLIALQRIRLAMRYTKLVVVNGKTFATPKEDIIRYIGFSPNEFDSAVYWNWIRNNKKVQYTGSAMFSTERV